MILIMEEELKVSKDLMKAVSAETRTEILKALENRQMTASELSRYLDKHVTTVAEHLELLHNSKLVERIERPGRKWIYYKLSNVGKQMLHPQPYRIILVLTLSFLTLGIGAYFIPLYTSGIFAANIYERGAASMPLAVQQTKTDASNVDFVLPVLLVLIAAVGIVYSIQKIRKDYSSLGIPE
jgi:DNA-binding transcriptional ArsR family regulator